MNADPLKYPDFFKRICFFLLIICSNLPAKAQYSRYIIQLKNKNGTPYSLTNPSEYLSPRAIQRRTKQNIKIDSSDLPINPAYLDSIKQVPNLMILNYSKWLNQVLVKITDSAALSEINDLAFVKQVSPVALAANNYPIDSIQIKVNKAHIYHRYESITGENQTENIQGASQNYFDYATAYTQIHIHHGEFLHNLGFHGEGICIAILDAGFFQYLSNPAFDSVRQNNQVLGTYDYVNLKQSVNEENSHGAYCFSIIAANEPGQMVGSAPKAMFWLFKTEDVSSEYPVEEQNWIAAAEFADSAGADLISTSLGYAYFDDPSFDLDYSERDGHESMISKAANFAVGKGMIVTVSAGNSGDDPDETKYVDCPADADSVLTIGAINSQGAIASFSSWGPNASGQLKPDVVSVGEGTTIAAPNGMPVSGSGTSFSNPNLAGLIACLWQAFPDFTNHDIIDAVRRSSDRYAHPDEQYGYGIPDFSKAYLLLENKRQFLHFIATMGDQWISVYPVPFNNYFTVVFKSSVNGKANLQLLDATGRIIETKSITVTPGVFSSIQFDHSYFLTKGIYFIHYDDGNQKKTLKIIKQ